MKKTTIIVIAMILAVSLLFAACSVPSGIVQSASADASGQASTIPTQEAIEKKWIVSELAGAVTADMSLSPKDDFFAFTNQEWLSTTKVPEGQFQIHSFMQIKSDVQKQLLDLIADESQTSHEAKLVQKFYNDFIDMETRNRRGVEPIMPQIKAIQKISSIDELTDYYVTDWEHKLSSYPMLLTVRPDMKDSTKYTVQIQSPDCSLGDSSEYKTLTARGKLQKQATTLVFSTMLERVGYSKEEAAKVTEQLFEMEGKVQKVSATLAEQQQPGFLATMYHPITISELKEQSPVFPVAEILKPYTDLGIEQFDLSEPEWLANMNKLYVEENLEGFKALLLYEVISNSLLYLDQEAFDLESQKLSILAGSEVKLKLEDVAYKHVDRNLNKAIGKMYAENYVSPKTKADVTKMADEIVAVFRDRLNKAEWLSDVTRVKALGKLDTLKLRIAYPDDWTPYAYTELNFDEENGTVENLIDTKAYDGLNRVKQAAGKVDRSLWAEGPQTTNSSYSPQENAIEIYGGVLRGNLYNENNSREANMGGIGVIIAHEITHAFDTQGSQYDKDGNMINWWTEEDSAAFKELTSKVSQYYSQFEVMPGVFINGDLTIGESVADLGAMSCMLEIANGIEDFDYKTFFESFAYSFRRQAPPNVIEDLVNTDVHPLCYLRINITLQQNQEFYDAIGIKEGDGMYLAPEDRLTVW